jgi:hypothetical protein
MEQLDSQLPAADADDRRGHRRVVDDERDGKLDRDG